MLFFFHLFAITLIFLKMLPKKKVNDFPPLSKDHLPFEKILLDFIVIIIFLFPVSSMLPLVYFLHKPQFSLQQIS